MWGIQGLEDYHPLHQDFRINHNTASFLCTWFKKHSSEIAFFGVCKLPYPCVSLLCFQEFSDAILEWQPSLQHWLRLMKLILVPRVDREKSSLELKGLSGAWVQELCGVTGHTAFHL